MSSGRAHNVRVRVLVVEDHVALANRIGEGLRDAGFAVDVVYDGAAALDSTSITEYDVLVLDRDLPGVHGDRVCRQLVRNGSPTRVVKIETPTIARRGELRKPKDPAELERAVDGIVDYLQKLELL